MQHFIGSLVLSGLPVLPRGGRQGVVFTGVLPAAMSLRLSVGTMCAGVIACNQSETGCNWSPV